MPNKGCARIDRGRGLLLCPEVWPAPSMSDRKNEKLAILDDVKDAVRKTANQHPTNAVVDFSVGLG